MKGKIIVAVPTGENDHSSDIKFSVYPVPLRGNELTVVVKNSDQKKIDALIYNLAGNLKVIRTIQTVDGKFSIDVASLSRGIYLLQLKTDDGLAFGKIVRE
jgi:hypothetical protein